MSHDDLATIFRRGMEAYSRGDYEAAVVGFDPAIEWSVHASVASDATTYHGHEGSSGSGGRGRRRSAVLRWRSRSAAA
jgi:hypothetical protein